MRRCYDLNGQALETWLLNYYLEICEGLPNMKYCSWEFCNMHPPPWLDRLGIQKSVISSNQVVVLIQITLVLKRKQGDFREWLYQIKEDKHKVIFMKQLVLCK